MNVSFPNIKKQKKEACVEVNKNNDNEVRKMPCCTQEIHALIFLLNDIFSAFVK